jgi:hypothetical protein
MILLMIMMLMINIGKFYTAVVLTQGTRLPSAVVGGVMLSGYYITRRYRRRVPAPRLPFLRLILIFPALGALYTNA